MKMLLGSGALEKKLINEEDKKTTGLQNIRRYYHQLSKSGIL